MLCRGRLASTQQPQAAPQAERRQLLLSCRRLARERENHEAHLDRVSLYLATERAPTFVLPIRERVSPQKRVR